MSQSNTAIAEEPENGRVSFHTGDIDFPSHMPFYLCYLPSHLVALHTISCKCKSSLYHRGCPDTCNCCLKAAVLLQRQAVSLKQRRSWSTASMVAARTLSLSDRQALVPYLLPDDLAHNQVS